MSVDLVAEILALDPPEQDGRREAPEWHLTDMGNARRFRARHARKVRYVKALGWYIFDGTRHHRDEVDEVTRKAMETVTSIYGEAAVAVEKSVRKEISAHAGRSEQEPRIKAMLKLAQALPGIALPPDSFDRDPLLFGVGNGVLDLRDCNHRPTRPDDLISRGTDVPWEGPEAPTPRWDRFLAEVFDGEVGLINFIQRFAGYCLTGDTSEQILTVFHGTGCNGKTELVETLKAVSGRYAATAPFDTFTRSRGQGGPRNDIARLAGARLVVASESAEGRRLDEAMVKQVTGSDTIAARFLYGEHFEFKPQFKPILVTNFQPKVDGGDNALWRRLRLVQFNQSFEGREDRHLREALRSELPGILAWAARGCLDWQERGLGAPATVTEATSQYRHDSDVLGAFLDERCCTGDGEVLARVLREALGAYCEELGEEPPTASRLGQRLKQRGIESTRGAQGRRSYIGIHLGDGCQEAEQSE